MIEPIHPSAYLAIASAAHNRVTKYKDNRRAKNSAKLAHISSANSSNESSLVSSTSLNDLLAQEGLELNEAAYIQFCPDSPAHPRAWSKARKVYDLVLIMSMNFVMSAMSNAGTPVVGYAMETFGVGRVVGLLGFTTVYLIGLAFGHLLVSPYADGFGRKTLYVASAFLFSIFCIPVAATPRIAAVFIGRFVTGFVSAIPRMTVISSIDDLFDEGSEGRSWALFASSLTSNIGLVIGPIYASQIAVALNWRWPFYISTIILCALSLLILTTTESSPTNLLTRKLALLQSNRPDLDHHAAPPPLSPSPYRPLTLLFTSPFLLITTLISSLTLSLLYILPLPLPQIYTSTTYTLTSQTSISLSCLTIPGLLFTFLPRYSDHLKSNTSTSLQKPMHHCSALTITIAALALPTALWWFAWTIPPYTITTPWIASALSLIVLGYAIGEITFALPQSLGIYISRAAAAAADERSVRTAMGFLQGIVAGGGVLVAEVLYTNLNNNIATSVFAAIATVVGVLLLGLVYGNRTRREGGGGVGGEAGGRGLLEKRRKGEERREQRGGKRRYTGGSEDGAFTVEIAGGWTPYPYPCLF